MRIEEASAELIIALWDFYLDKIEIDDVLNLIKEESK